MTQEFVRDEMLLSLPHDGFASMALLTSKHGLQRLVEYRTLAFAAGLVAAAAQAGKQR